MAYPFSSCDYHLYSFYPRTVGDYHTLPDTAVWDSSAEI